MEGRVVAVQEAEGVHVVANRLGAAVCPGEVLPGVAAVAAEERIEVLVRTAVEAEDVLPGITDKEDLQGRVHLQEQVEDPVVELGKVLCLVDDKHGYLVLEPLAETEVAQVVDECGQDVIDGDDVVSSLEFANELLEAGVLGGEPGFQAGLYLLDAVLVVELDAEFLCEFGYVRIVDDDEVELLSDGGIVALDHLEAEGMEGAVVEFIRLGGPALESGLAEFLAEFVGCGVCIGQGDDLLRLA